MDMSTKDFEDMAKFGLFPWSVPNIIDNALFKGKVALNERFEALGNVGRQKSPK